jgi:hypothetical protein
MGAIGTALEKLCAIKLVINQTDTLKRHMVEFHNSKYEDVNKEKDYFFIHTEKGNDNKIRITGISDSNGLIQAIKGNSKINNEDFKSFLIGLINNSSTSNDKLRKNIIPVLMNKLNLGKTSVYNKIDDLIEREIIKEVDGELLVNLKTPIQIV